MNTFAYLKLILNEELLAIKELLFEQRWLVLVLAALVFGLVYYLKPFPPRNIYIAAGDQGSGYWKTAESYAYYFQENGVSLNPVETAGSIENAKLLADNKSDVRVAVIQGGALDSVDADKFYSLGSIAYEPLWIFYRIGIANPPKTLADLTHLRIGTGPTLGGTQKLFHDVMQVTGFTDKVFKEEIQASYQENLKAFNEGKLDVIVKVASYHDPEIQALVKDPDVGLMPIADAAAYQKGLPYLYALNIPINSIDIAKGIPSHSIPLIGTTTSLIVDKDLHPDIQMLLLVATRDIQRSSQSLFFAKRGEFPAYVDPTVEASPVALHYYDYGVPPGMRYLPFWLAGFINRMWVLILSVIAFTYPLAKLNLQLREIRYHIKHRRLYEELLGTELFLCEKTPSVSELGRISDRLKHLNREAINVRVPVGSEAEYFDLLQAIELLRAKVRERVETT